MNITIRQSKIAGTISAPPSKSYTHRAVITATLAQGTSKITGYLQSDDTDRTLVACEQLGATIHINGPILTITGTNGFQDTTRGPKHISLDLGNSGTSARFITALASISTHEVTIDGSKRLQERPMEDLIRVLNEQGIRIQSLKRTGHLPLHVSGGILRGGICTFSSVVSSQFLSAFLLISPYAKGGLIIQFENLRSRPYVDITLAVMKHFGADIQTVGSSITVGHTPPYQNRDYSIEGDYSSVSYFFAAAAITGGRICITGLNPESAQGDRYFLSILQKMGCSYAGTSKGIIVSGKATKPLDIDMGNYPDIVPSLAIVCASVAGRSVIRNIAHLRHKESDRITALAQELVKMGVSISESEDSLTIVGSTNLKGARIKTYNDHRIAMSFAILGLITDGETTIQDAHVVAKSYPDFWKDFQTVGGMYQTL